MKKIIVLLLAMLLVLPIIPAYAADRTVVYVQNYNNISDDLMVFIKTPSNSFQGATISVGDSISYTLEGEGAGSHTALIDVSSLTSDGEVSLRVEADYGGDGIDTVEKVINLSKIAAEKTEYNYENLDILTNLNNGLSVYEKVDESSVKVTWTSAENKDYRLGWGSDGSGGTVSTEGKNINPSGANLLLEFEVLFQNGNDSETKEKPAAYTTMSFRQDRNKSVASGYPTNSSNNTSIGGDFALFNSNGKIDGSGAEYKTNTWYKCRLVFDMVSKKDDGTLIGGLTFMVAEKDTAPGAEYGDFIFQKYQANYLLNNLRHFRFNPRAGAANCSMTFKNMSITREEPLKSWYFDNSSYANGKINVKFTEDMGQLSPEDFKIFNTVPDEISVNSVTKIADGEYEIVTEKSELKFGREYDLYVKCGLKSAAGAIAFQEPADAEDYWKADSFTTAEYALNVASALNSSDKATITFNNSGISDKFAAVCWFDNSGNMVDCIISPITAADGESQEFLRTTNTAAANIKVVIFGSENGADKVYDIHEN